jgi:hypothetical protein
VTSGILPSALRASFAVRPAPAAQGLSKRKSPKRRTPHGARPREEAPRVRVRRPVAPTVRPCTEGAMGAIHRAHPCGPFGRRPPAAEGSLRSRAQAEQRKARREQARGAGGGKCQGRVQERTRVHCRLGRAMKQARTPALRAQERAFALPGFPLRPGERVEEEARRGACTDARAFVVGTGCAVNEPRNPLAQSTDRMSGDRDARVPFFWLPFLWASTAPQERRERRCGPEGRWAVCPESRKVTRSPPWRAEQ